MKSERNRYIAFEILCGQEITFKELINTIWRNLSSLFGESGTSKTGLWLMALDRVFLEEGTDFPRESSNIYLYKGILRTNHLSTDMVRTALAFTSEIYGKSALFNVLGISGTIKTAREKYLSI